MSDREMRTVNRFALTKLPWVCAHRNRMTGETILIVRGEDGYIPATDLIKNADTFNHRLGIDAFQATAMESGSMFGWDVPGCDPDGYREEGLRPITGSYTELEKAPEVEPVAPPEYPTYDPMAPQSIADHVVTAFEGGSSWIEEGMTLNPTAHLDQPWYSDPKFYEGDWGIEIATNDDDPFTGTITEEKWTEALKRMQANHPKHWDDLMADNSDAITSDVLIQLALFGELVYG